METLILPKREIIESLTSKYLLDVIGSDNENDLKYIVKKESSFVIKRKLIGINETMLSNLSGDRIMKLIKQEDIEFYEKQIQQLILLEKEGFEIETLVIDGTVSNVQILMKLLSNHKFKNIKYFYFIESDNVCTCCIPSSGCLYDHTFDPSNYDWQVKFPFESFPNLFYFCWEEKLLPFDYNTIPTYIKHLRLVANFCGIDQLKPTVNLEHLKSLEIIEVIQYAYWEDGNTLALGFLSMFPNLKRAFVYYSNTSRLIGRVSWDLLFPKCTFENNKFVGTRDYKFPSSLIQIGIIFTLQHLQKYKDEFEKETLIIKEKNSHIQEIVSHWDPKYTMISIPYYEKNISIMEIDKQNLSLNTLVRFEQNGEILELSFEKASKSKVLMDLMMDNIDQQLIKLESPFYLKYIKETFDLCTNQSALFFLSNYDYFDFKVISAIYNYYEIKELKEDIMWEWRRRILFNTKYWHDLVETKESERNSLLRRVFIEYIGWKQNKEYKNFKSGTLSLIK